MSTKILITGALGQLGYAVIEQLRNKYDFFISDIKKQEMLDNYVYLDITDSTLVDKVFSKYDPEIIINLAGFTDVDQCELQPELARALNTKSVELLIKKFRGKIIHISTDYVFDGCNGPYSEEDITNPINIYGQTKLQAEKIIAKGSEDWCIIRTNVLFDYHDSTKASFVKWVIDSLRGGKEINVVNDQWNNPTWTKNLAEIIELVIEKDVKGLYHFGGTDYINRYDFAIMIAKIYDFDNKLIKSISTESLNQLAKRPLMGGLKTNKIEETLNIKCNKLTDSLLDIKSRMSK